ncbi:hypothetical protein FJ934_25515 [Mesorhizobium sp. B2-4-12]|nr:hypothetical protein FJ934_25515 [Mesorhizobium sp. B2-4-12]
MRVLTSRRSSVAPPSVLPPLLGGIAVRAPRPIWRPGRLAKAGMTAISPPVGEMSGRTEGGAVERWRTNCSRGRKAPETQNPPRRRVIGANQHHGQICNMAALSRSTIS